MLVNIDLCSCQLTRLSWSIQKLEKAALPSLFNMGAVTTLQHYVHIQQVRIHTLKYCPFSDLSSAINRRRVWGLVMKLSVFKTYFDKKTEQLTLKLILEN